MLLRKRTCGGQLGSPRCHRDPYQDTQLFIFLNGWLFGRSADNLCLSIMSGVKRHKEPLSKCINAAIPLGKPPAHFICRASMKRSMTDQSHISPAYCSPWAVRCERIVLGALCRMMGYPCQGRRDANSNKTIIFRTHLPTLVAD